MSKPYKRVVLKISGESFASEGSLGIHPEQGHAWRREATRGDAWLARCDAWRRMASHVRRHVRAMRIDVHRC